VPGVEHASATLSVPFGGRWSQPLRVPGVDSTRLRDFFYVNPVGADYFATMGTRVLRGRPITDADRDGTQPVAVISQSAAERVWPDRDPLGNCVKLDQSGPCLTIVGVVQDIRPTFADRPRLQLYLSMAQQPQPRWQLFVRTRGEAAGNVETLRRALQELAPGSTFVNVRPLEDMVSPQRRSWKLGATMFTVFGVLALVVAAVGLYSVVAYDVSQRTQELGVRIALGATTGSVLRLVVAEGVRVVAVGLLLGAAMALALAKRVTPLLFDVTGRDPATYAGVIIVLMAVAVAASLAPALRAARVDPNVALRVE
jgi:putative ABC transport system permease protein